MTDYITLTEWKYTAEQTGFSFADYDIEQAITAASRGIDEFTGRWFYPNPSTVGTVITRYFTPYTNTVDIDDLLTCSTVATDYDGDGTFEHVWSGIDYQLEPFNAAADGKPYERLTRRPWSSQLLPCWPGSLAVTGVFGWSEVPAPVKQATTIMATRLLRRAREAPFGVVGLGLDNAPVRIAKIDPDVAFLLNPFVKGGGVLAA